MDKLVLNAEGLNQKASGEKKQNLLLFKKLEKTSPSVLDQRFRDLHDYYTEKIDCLACANCCKTISPAVSDQDIDRIARHLKRKPSAVSTEYFTIDEDGDYVFTTQPCPFLGPDNYCAIYEVRPKACREYPHMDRSRQHKILDITYKNISVCPIVYNIVRDLKSDFG